MTDKANLYIYRVKTESKRIKKIKLKKFLKDVNLLTCRNIKFYVNKKDARI